MAKDENQALKLISSTSFDPKNTVVIEGNFKKNIFKQSIGKIYLLKDTDEEIIMNTENNKDNVLVVADSYYPGWQATIDGKETEIFPANINQRAIFVGAGQHQIRFKFISQSFETGKKISIIFFILWTGLFIISMKVGRNHPDSKDDSE
jgi:uncharacterized membrane protein YfhO